MTSQLNLWTIPAGVRFLPAFVDALLSGRLVATGDDPAAALASATIYVPTRRAARSLRALFVERMGGRAAILPTIRPLGEFDEDADFMEIGTASTLAPPVSNPERLLVLARLIKQWKSRLPAHVAALLGDAPVVPASTADAIWLARDLAALLDAVETEEADWRALGDLVPEDLSAWWQVTVEFLDIVTRFWPEILAEQQRSDPARWRSAQICAETERLRNRPVGGPVIAAGSTGSIPATARLLAAIAQLPDGAVVLPGLDNALDSTAWDMIGEAAAPAIHGHPQYGLRKLLGTIGADRNDVVELAAPSDILAARNSLVSEALRPAETTQIWSQNGNAIAAMLNAGALDQVTLIEAADERQEALSIAIALRLAVSAPGHRAALVTGDRDLARRVSSELTRFGIIADDSGGRPLLATPAASLMCLLADISLRPGGPAILLDLLTHPLLHCGLARSAARTAAEFAELAVLRGHTGRLDILDVLPEFDRRAAELIEEKYPPVWHQRFGDDEKTATRVLLQRLMEAVAPLCELRGQSDIGITDVLVTLVRSLEAVGRSDDGSLALLYQGDAGETLVENLKSLIAIQHSIRCSAQEAPDVVRALLATETVKPAMAGDGRVAIWGVLEARLQSVDTLVIGALNEDQWPRTAKTGPFLSRSLAGGLGLEPPERRTGQAAHDFQMAMGAENVVLARSARSNGAPTSPSRWLQRLLAICGDEQATELRRRGKYYLDLSRSIDATAPLPSARQPNPKPALDVRPRHFSVTEIETLRRDPYAIYVRRILNLEPLKPIGQDPGAAERGSLFHEILHRFVVAKVDPAGADAQSKLLEIGSQCFAEAALPADIHAIWWPRFVEMVPAIVDWERQQSAGVAARLSEVASIRLEIGATGITLSGRADRIDLLDGGAHAEVLDYKTGSSPSRRQAHRLLAPQLALEGALLQRGAFEDPGAVEPAELKFVRLRSDSSVTAESILEIRGSAKSIKTAASLADEAWQRLEQLIARYSDPDKGYLSRALPLREHDLEGDYDHLARVQEWSSGVDGDDGGGSS